MIKKAQEKEEDKKKTKNKMKPGMTANSKSIRIIYNVGGNLFLQLPTSFI